MTLPPAAYKCTPRAALGRRPRHPSPCGFPPLGFRFWVGVRMGGVQRGETLGGGGGSPAAIPFSEANLIKAPFRVDNYKIWEKTRWDIFPIKNSQQRSGPFFLYWASDRNIAKTSLEAQGESLDSTNDILVIPRTFKEKTAD